MKAIKEGNEDALALDEERTPETPPTASKKIAEVYGRGPRECSGHHAKPDPGSSGSVDTLFGS